MLKNFLINIINSIFKIQNSILNLRYAKNGVHKTSMTKSHITSSASLSFTGELEKNKRLVNEEVRQIALLNKNNLVKVFDFAKDKGVNFYSLKNGEKILKLIGEESGLIFKKSGMGAFFLNLLTTNTFSFKSPAMFVFDDKKLSACNILYHFYRWYASCSNLPGYEEETLKRFKNVFEYEKNLDKLSYEEIISLKHAIARDKEAMDFVLKFIKEIEGSKNAFGVLKNNDNGANI